MIQPFHFWVFTQRKQKHYFDKISILLYSLHHHCKMWKQPTYPLMDKWIQEVWCTHTHTHTEEQMDKWIQEVWCTHTHTHTHTQRNIIQP